VFPTWTWTDQIPRAGDCVRVGYRDSHRLFEIERVEWLPHSEEVELVLADEYPDSDSELNQLVEWMHKLGFDFGGRWPVFFE
jgi:hypothetical protein